MQEGRNCQNCGAELQGAFCYRCGEKVVERKDFSLKVIFGKAFESITNLDSKFLRSMKLLLFLPGKLTRHHVEGKRVPFVKPFQLFLLANVLFYLALPDLDVFRVPSLWYFSESGDGGISVAEHVERIMLKKEMSWDRVAKAYDDFSTNASKLLLILLLPLFGLVIWLLHLRKKMQFGMHVIFSLHAFASLMFISVLISWIGALFGLQNGRFYAIIIGALVFVHYLLSVKRFYNEKWWKAVLKSLLAYFLIMALIATYRNSVSWFSLFWVGW